MIHSAVVYSFTDRSNHENQWGNQTKLKWSSFDSWLKADENHILEMEHDEPFCSGMLSATTKCSDDPF